jgi:hypothetical protein
MRGGVNIYLAGEQMTGRLVNMSATGLALTCDVRRDGEQPVQVEFDLGSSIGWLRLEARLVRDENLPAGYLWGLMFINLSPWVHYYLEGYVEDQIARRNHVAS